MKKIADKTKHAVKIYEFYVFGAVVEMYTYAGGDGFDYNFGPVVVGVSQTVNVIVTYFGGPSSYVIHIKDNTGAVLYTGGLGGPFALGSSMILSLPVTPTTSTLTLEIIENPFSPPGGGGSHPYRFDITGMSYDSLITVPSLVTSTVCDEDGYHYGFNGQMKDNDWAGVGNHLDFGDRMYDSRIGRFLSLDPKMEQYPFMSPYVFAGNNPIALIDEDGDGPTYTLADRRNFYKLVGMPIVQALEAKGVSKEKAKFVVSQVLLEQGYAPYSQDKKHMWAAFAFFNVKGKGTKGSVSITTNEQDKHGNKYTIQAEFRGYNNMNESIDDYFSMLQRRFPEAYKSLFNPNSTIGDFSNGLQHGVGGAYATDKKYESLLASYYNTVDKQYSKYTGSNDPMKKNQGSAPTKGIPLAPLNKLPSEPGNSGSPKEMPMPSNPPPTESGSLPSNNPPTESGSSGWYHK